MLFLVPAALAVAGIAFTLFAAALVSRWQVLAMPPRTALPAVTILKPLHGSEPRLAANLRTFIDQDYPAPVQILCGVSDPADTAVPIARALGLNLLVEPTRHGNNGKVSTLVNMEPHITGELVVLSDSDMSVAPDYLRRIATAIACPGVGALTCLYAGRGDAGGWSRLAAAGISWQFLPGVLVGLALGLAKPCMGSTVAFRHETLAAIGGFRRFADLLADDHAIGAAVRECGLAVVVPPILLTHGCAERSLRDLVQHELRWQRTIRLLDPTGHAGSIVTHPLALALIATALRPLAGLVLVIAAFAARTLLVWRIDRWAGRRTAPLALLPLRDLLSFAMFLGGLAVRRVRWRDDRLGVDAGGRMTRADAA